MRATTVLGSSRPPLVASSTARSWLGRVAKGETTYLLPELEHGLVERPSLAPQQLCFAHLEGLELALEGLPALHNRRGFSPASMQPGSQAQQGALLQWLPQTVPCQAMLSLASARHQHCTCETQIAHCGRAHRSVSAASASHCSPALWDSAALAAMRVSRSSRLARRCRYALKASGASTAIALRCWTTMNLQKHDVHELAYTHGSPKRCMLF